MIKKNDDEVLQRISETLKKRGKYNKDLISFLGLTTGTYSNWKRKLSNSYLSYIEDIASYLGVSVEYLITGNATRPAINPLVLLPKEEAKLVECYRCLDDLDKKYLKDVMLSMVLKDDEGIGGTETHRIPGNDMHAYPQ